MKEVPPRRPWYEWWEANYDILPKCFALISLAQLTADDKRTLPILVEILDQYNPSQVENDPKGLRGYAALGLGIYCRPLNTPQGRADRPGFDKALQILARHLSDTRNCPEVRAACALALGLSGRTEALKLLVSEQLDNRQALVTGYALLGRAMLGDYTAQYPPLMAFQRLVNPFLMDRLLQN